MADSVVADLRPWPSRSDRRPSRGAAEAVAAEPEAVAQPEAVAEPSRRRTGGRSRAEAVAEPPAVTSPEPVAASDAVAAEAVAEPDVTTAPEADLAARRDHPGGRRAGRRSSPTNRPRPSMRPAPRSHRWPRPRSSSRSSPTSPHRRSQPEDKAAAQTSGLLRRFRPGQSLDAELEAYERDHTTEPIAAASRGVGRDTARQARPDRPGAGRCGRPGGAGAPSPRPGQPAPVVDDVVPQPVWQMVAPDPSTDVAGDRRRRMRRRCRPPRANAPDQAPQWPAGPQWPTTAGQANGLPFLGRPAAPQGGLEALWAESSREVVATPAVAGRVNGVVQPCVSCGLSLSANARFCRRCGTPQAG